MESGAGEVLVAGGPAEFGAGSNAVTGNRYTRLAWEQTRLALLARAAWAVMNLGNLAPLAASNNLVLTYDLHALRLPGHYRAGWAGAYWKLSAAAYRRARFRVTLTRTVADDLEATLGQRVDAVIPPGVDDAFRPAPAARIQALRDRLGLVGPYLTVVGWAQPGKRVTLAVAAHRLLVRDLPHQLVAVGARRTDFSSVEFGTLPASVVLPGRVSDEDLATLYSGSSGLVFCTQYEGFGLPPVEALACGAPVAASRLPVLEEVLGGLPGVSFVDGEDDRSWAVAMESALRSDQPAGRDDGPSARSAAVLARYPWEGKGRALLDIVHG